MLNFPSAVCMSVCKNKTHSSILITDVLIEFDMDFKRIIAFTPRAKPFTPRSMLLEERAHLERVPSP